MTRMQKSGSIVLGLLVTTTLLLFQNCSPFKAGGTLTLNSQDNPQKACANAPVLGEWSANLADPMAEAMSFNEDCAGQSRTCQSQFTFGPVQANQGQVEIKIITNNGDANCAPLGTYQCSYSIGSDAVGASLTYQCPGISPLTLYKVPETALTSVPFAYETRIDTLAHMSCAPGAVPANPGAYFTFRALASTANSSGIGFSADFVTAMAGKSNAEKLAALTAPVNLNASVNLAIRSTADLNNIWVTGAGGAPVRGESIDTLVGNLADPALLATIPVGIPPNHFINLLAGNVGVSASLRYMLSENVAATTRAALDTNEAALVVGNSESLDPVARTLRNPQGTAYGLKFSLPMGYSAGVQRVLSASAGVTEYKTNGNSIPSFTEVTNANWNCAQNFQFIIVRPEDVAAGRVLCRTGADMANNANEAAALAAIRRVLKTEDWFVDVVRKCVIPKATGDRCYGSLAGRSVMYGVASCINDATRLCPHFVNVCTRQ